MDSTKPTGFEDVLDDFGPQLYDGYCGEPIMWGFKVLSWLGEERWAELKKRGSLECLSWHPSKEAHGNYALITKWLTPEEAKQKYGEITDFEIGPQGGFRTVTYGDKKFVWPGVRPPFLRDLIWEWTKWKRIEGLRCPRGRSWAATRVKTFKDRDGNDIGRSTRFLKMNCEKGEFKFSNDNTVPTEICKVCPFINCLEGGPIGMR